MFDDSLGTMHKLRYFNANMSHTGPIPINETLRLVDAVKLWRGRSWGSCFVLFPQAWAYCQLHIATYHSYTFFMPTTDAKLSLTARPTILCG